VSNFELINLVAYNQVALNRATFRGGATSSPPRWGAPDERSRAPEEPIHETRQRPSNSTIRRSAPPPASRRGPIRRPQTTSTTRTRGCRGILTVDHKRIGIMYLVFVVGLLRSSAGLAASLVRALNLLTPTGRDPRNSTSYNKGLHRPTAPVMLFLFLIPVVPGGAGEFLRAADDRRQGTWRSRRSTSPRSTFMLSERCSSSSPSSAGGLGKPAGRSIRPTVRSIRTRTCSPPGSGCSSSASRRSSTGLKHHRHGSQDARPPAWTWGPHAALRLGHVRPPA